jgi:uncharacterized delta-60 repeat protein
MTRCGAVAALGTFLALFAWVSRSVSWRWAPAPSPSRSPTRAGTSGTTTRIWAFTATAIVVLAASSLAVAPAHATPGDLDPTFSGDGKATTDFGGGGDYGGDVAAQADGKIVVVGGTGSDFALARYNADGSLDSSFDGDGKVTTDLGGGADGGADVAVHADGKIVVVGGAPGASRWRVTTLTGRSTAHSTGTAS